MLNKFNQYLITEKRFSEHTCTAYAKDLSQFMEFTSIDLDEDFKEVESSLIRAWMVDMIESGYASSSVNRKVSSLKTFFRWLLKEGFIEFNPAKPINGPKKEKRLPSFVQEKDLEIEKVEMLFTDDFSGLRDRLMIEMLYQTGIRSSELVGLQDSNISDTSIRVKGKGGKDRVIPISSELYQLVLQYKELRRELSFDHGLLFVLDNGKKLYPKFVYRKINSYLGKATELEKKSPHVLRHTFATHMLNSGAGLEVLKELLGHANLSATQIYTHNSFAQLTSIYSQSHPRGHKK